MLPTTAVRFLGFREESLYGKARSRPIAIFIITTIFGLSGVLNAILYRLTRGSFFQGTPASEPLAPHVMDPNDAHARPFAPAVMHANDAGATFYAPPVMHPNDARVAVRAPPVADPNENDEYDPYASNRIVGEPYALDVLAPAGDPLALPHRNLDMNSTSEGSSFWKGSSPS